MAKIVVHEKALAHLSRGLYRSPASALRELISNGWDANARNVWVDTNYPHFFQISIRDDGDGFCKEDFERLMSGNIGNSEKRPRNKQLINSRPTIGRLGIGMLGIAQICGTFILTSKPVKGKPFCAKIRLYDLIKERLDKDDKDVTRVSKVESGEEISELRVVDVGDYEFIEDFDSSAFEKGTSIVTENVHPQFTQSFVETIHSEFFIDPSLDWSEILLAFQKVPAVQLMGDYWQLIWELAVSCPITYSSPDCLPEETIKRDYHRLKGYDFNVFVDGIKLTKPVYLKDNPAGYTITKIANQEHRVYGRDLHFHGYLLVQEGKQIHPDELRGIAIRIKDVAIGYYDQSLLDYRINEGPRSRWLTGEIFVSIGLEDALNVDRDSFNKFHPQYRLIQRFVHDLLQKELFKKVYANIDERTKARQRKRLKERREYFQEVVGEFSGTKIAIDYAKNASGVSVKHTASRLEVTLPEPEGLGTKKGNRELAAAIMAIFEIAAMKPRLEERREVFNELLLELLRKW